MKYLGMDVHGKATVYCLLDGEGQVLERGSLATTAAELTKLVCRLLSTDELLCGQEVGTMSHFVHDVVTGAVASDRAPGATRSHAQHRRRAEARAQ